MIVREPRWHHYLMIPLQAQIVVTILAGIIIMLQLAVYAVMADPVVVFSGSCSHVMGGLVANGEQHQGVYAQCGDDLVDLKTLETPFLYQLLTTKTTPVILCEKTRMEYVGDVRWTCDIQNGKHNQ